MDEASQGFLISAKVIFNNLVTMKNAIDYSGVCLLVSKDFVVEISKRFFRAYISYLAEHYPWKTNKEIYPTILLNRYGKPMKSHQFALGNVSFVLCQKVAEDITEEQDLNNRAKLIEYLSSEVFVGKREDEIWSIIFLKKILYKNWIQQYYNSPTQKVLMIPVWVSIQYCKHIALHPQEDSGV